MAMTDISTYYDDFLHPRPKIMDKSDIRSWSTDCMCSVCEQRKESSLVSGNFLFEDWRNIALEYHEELTPMQYLLCPNRMPVFILKTRSWGKFTS